MAVWFIAIVLTGFIPDALDMVAAVKAGQRPPLPIVLHVHAVLMASFLLLLLTQTVLMAAGRSHLHRQLGAAAFVLAPALVIVGIILVPTIYHSLWSFGQAGGPEVQAKTQQGLRALDNIMLLQLRIGVLFPLFLFIGLRARSNNSGFHKRMMILATAIPLAAGIDRIAWLPTTLPVSALAGDLYILAAVAPMFAWDVIRNRRVHEAYLVWLGVSLPVALVLYRLWDTPGWHSMAHRLMGV
ncbi:MAG: hypothetical protein ACREEB_13370 [Caulobacteraceae bacterium]